MIFASLPEMTADLLKITKQLIARQMETLWSVEPLANLIKELPEGTPQKSKIVDWLQNQANLSKAMGDDLAVLLVICGQLSDHCEEAAGAAPRINAPSSQGMQPIRNTAEEPHNSPWLRRGDLGQPKIVARALPVTHLTTQSVAATYELSTDQLTGPKTRSKLRGIHQELTQIMTTSVNICEIEGKHVADEIKTSVDRQQEPSSYHRNLSCYYEKQRELFASLSPSILDLSKLSDGEVTDEDIFFETLKKIQGRLTDLLISLFSLLYASQAVEQEVFDIDDKTNLTLNRERAQLTVRWLRTLRQRVMVITNQEIKPLVINHAVQKLREADKSD